MDWRKDCVAVIPCLNEATTIGLLVREVTRHVPKVIVVDDGSKDDTACIARVAGAEVLRNQMTCGKGAALQQGWTLANQLGYAWALTLDGDGQHSAADIPSFFACAQRTGAALVVGNRMGDSARMPPLRRTVNRWMSNRLSNAAGRPLPDSQCGFRLMNLNAWSRLVLKTAHFEIESELLLAFVRAGHAVEFVPTCALYKNEQSKIHPLRDTLRWLKWWAHARRCDMGPSAKPQAFTTEHEQART